jgi:hypothetical protein
MILYGINAAIFAYSSVLNPTDQSVWGLLHMTFLLQGVGRIIGEPIWLGIFLPIIGTMYKVTLWIRYVSNLILDLLF